MMLCFSTCHIMCMYNKYYRLCKENMNKIRNVKPQADYYELIINEEMLLSAQNRALFGILFVRALFL